MAGEQIAGSEIIEVLYSKNSDGKRRDFQIMPRYSLA
jgi:hypothetical protein